MSNLSGFEKGSELVHVVELRSLDDVPVSFDEHFFPVDVVGDLKAADVEDSIFDYLENKLGVSIATSKRIIDVVPATPEVCEALGLAPHSYIARTTSQTYSIAGRVMELTISRHHPAHFRFAYTANRRIPR